MVLYGVHVHLQVNRMGLEAAYEKARKDLEELRPHIAAPKGGVRYEEGRFIIPFFNRTFFLHHPEMKVEEKGSDEPPPQWLEILLMHYLINADGTPASGMWIIYRHLPGAYLFEQRFTNSAINPLLEGMGNDMERFTQAAQARGGTSMSRTGDAAFRFMALPKIPMGCILYLGDEEVPSAVNILFDAVAPQYLPTEDLSILGIYLSRSLLSYRALGTDTP